MQVPTDLVYVRTMLCGSAGEFSKFVDRCRLVGSMAGGPVLVLGEDLPVPRISVTFVEHEEHVPYGMGFLVFGIKSMGDATLLTLQVNKTQTQVAEETVTRIGIVYAMAPRPVFSPRMLEKIPYMAEALFRLGTSGIVGTPCVVTATPADTGRSVIQIPLIMV
jgi:hypothetical protein